MEFLLNEKSKVNNEFYNPFKKEPFQKNFNPKQIFKQIEPKAYFFDYISVNWQIEFTKFSYHDKEIISKFYPRMHELIEKRLLILKQNNRCLYAIDFKKKDTHYNFKMDFQGKFFKDRTYSIDLKHFYKWFLEFDNMLKYYWSRIGINKKAPRSTISRLDLSNHKKGTFLKKFIPIRSNKGNNPCNTWTHEKYDFITGIIIAGTSKSSIFTAYDKRWQKQGIEHCLERFGSVEVIRREWKMYSKYLRNHGISTVKSFMDYFNDPLLVSGLIKKLRISKDVILSTDNKLYRSLHDIRFKNAIQGNWMTINEFNKIFKSTYNVYLGKIPMEEINKLKWNPTGTLNGLVKYIGNMRKEEFLDFQTNLLNKLQDQHVEEWDYCDWDEQFYEKMVNILNILKTVKIKEK